MFDSVRQPQCLGLIFQWLAVGRLWADNRIQLGISFSKDSEWQSYKDWILFKPKFLPKKTIPKKGMVFNSIKM
jgi:hypothetical protein